VLGLYIDVSGDHSLDSLDDILFFLSVIPFGLLAFLDPEGEPNNFDRLHIFDFVQVCIFWLSILLCFSRSVWSPDTAFRIGPIIWSRSIAFDGLLVATFVVRAWLTKSRSVRSLFGRIACFLVLSGVADSYALNRQQDLQPGGWFDLVWSALLAIPILIAATWKGADESEYSPRAQRVLVNQVLPLLYPLGSFVILTHVHEAYPAPSLALFALAFMTFAVRAMVIQHRQGQSRDKLRQSELQYRLLFDSNPVPMWVFDRKTLMFLAVNEAATRQYGFSRPEFLTMTIADIRPGEDIPALLQATATTPEGLQVATNWRHRKKDGTIIDVEIVGHNLSFHGIEAELIAASDISERRRSEETVKRLASIVEFSQDAIIGKNMDGTITSWNRAAERMYGYSSAEVIGRDLLFLLPGDRQAELGFIMERMQKGLAIECMETQRVNKAGSLLEVSLSISPIQDAGARVIGVSTIARDITAHKRSIEQLRWQSAALEAAANAIVITDSLGSIMWVNSAFTRMTGYSKEEVLGKNPRLLKSNEHPENYYAELWSTISSGKHWRGEITNKRKDGTTYIEEMTITPVIRDSSNPANRYFIAIKQDITERRKSEEGLLFKTALLEAQAETTIDGILVVDESNHIVLSNRQFGLQFGIEDEVLLAKDDQLVLNRVTAQVEDPDTFVKRVKYLYNRRTEKARDEFSLKSGKIFDRYTAPLMDSKGQHRGRIWYFRDITDRKVAEQRVQYLAYYDDLTGLANRTLLQDRLAKAVADARRQTDKVALLFLDLDRFKDINDSLGHSVGDQLLQGVADRLRKWAREQDTIARLGGDEFVVMLTHVVEAPDVAVAAGRIMDAISDAFVVQGRSLNVTCSIGISIFPEHGGDGETLIKNADAAMYSAKHGGRGNFRFFTEELNTQAMERVTLENSLRSAVAREELFLMYQPQIDIATGKITGVEALLRWQHPQLGLIPPDKFIRIAENSGLIVRIGEWVLRTACSQARKWQEVGLPRITVAVNVSAIQFRQEGFCGLVSKVLEETGLPPQYLELELTESLLLANAELMSPVVRELRDMGVMLAIDDFGTGYSNFSYLKRFRINKLKIDQSLIKDVAVNTEDAAITTAVIGMAKSLHLRVIAEGVEDEAQVSFLRDHQCDEIQGYYFSKPLAADDIADKLQSNDGLTLGAAARFVLSADASRQTVLKQ
jgi:diguanylate cyclase (GGDEF)-like protein/PAS domain S-box-containing protein